MGLLFALCCVHGRAGLINFSPSCPLGEGYIKIESVSVRDRVCVPLYVCVCAAEPLKLTQLNRLKFTRDRAGDEGGVHPGRRQ